VEQTLFGEVWERWGLKTGSGGGKSRKREGCSISKVHLERQVQPKRGGGGGEGGEIDLEKF